MHARQKIESLTNSWYGFAVFSALFTLFLNGVGFFSVASSIVSTLISFVITFFIGRALLNKSTFVRYLMIVISGIGSAAGIYATGKMGLAFMSNFSLQGLLFIVFSVISVSMQVRSLRTLLDKSVSTYFG